MARSSGGTPAFTPSAPPGQTAGDVRAGTPTPPAGRPPLPPPRPPPGPAGPGDGRRGRSGAHSPT
eukprot:835427-Pleurochrysis_carterae.AAC.2